MARPPKSEPYEVFAANIEDARRLLHLAEVLVNNRQRRMRAERRRSLGKELGVPRYRQDELDCVESEHVFVVLKPDGYAERAHFAETQLRPLLRQSVVAIAAAVESYVYEKACCFISDVLSSEPPPRRLLDIPLSLEKVLWIEENYERRRWGQRRIIQDYLESTASADPGKVGIVFATVGKKSVWKAVDRKRKIEAGASERQLKEIADRRNRIAHTGDRRGAGKAPLSVPEVKGWLSEATEIVDALEATL